MGEQIILTASDTLELVPKKIIIWDNGLYFTETMLAGFITVGALLLFALIIRVFFVPRWRKNLKKISGFQILIESLVDMFSNTANETTPHISGFTSAWFFCVAAYICTGTIFELTGLRPPISDLNVTLALALLTFVLINVFGFIKNKAWRFTRYLNPLNIITDAVVPVSMTLRLFGSVFSGYLIMHILYTLMKYAPLQIVFTPVFSVIFTLFHALIQAYIFMVLSLNFIAEADEPPGFKLLVGSIKAKSAERKRKKALKKQTR